MCYKQLFFSLSCLENVHMSPMSLLFLSDGSQNLFFCSDTLICILFTFLGHCIQLTWLRVTYSEIIMKSQGMEFYTEQESLDTCTLYMSIFQFYHHGQSQSTSRCQVSQLSDALLKVINSISLLNLQNVNQFDVFLFLSPQ